MVNGNGMMVKTLLTVLVLALGAVGTLVVMGADSLNHHMDRVEAKVGVVEVTVDGVEAKQVAYDKQQARVAMTLDAIARKLEVPSAIDMTAANKIINGDSL